MPYETLEKLPIQMRKGAKNLVEDLGLLKAGILDGKSLRNAYSKVFNPVTVEVRDKNGKLKFMRYSHNVRTGAGIDWQARVMGGGGIGSAAAFQPGYASIATPTVAVTASTATTTALIVDTSTGAGTTAIAKNQYAGCTMAFATAAITTVPIIAHVVGNSVSSANAITWYVDGFFSALDPSTQVTAPAANTAYVVTNGGAAMYFSLSVNTGAQTGAGGADTTIGGITTSAEEITDANGLTRAYAGGASLWSHTAATNTYQLKHTWTASGAYTAVQQCGMWTGAGSYSGGRWQWPGYVGSSVAPATVTDLTVLGYGGGVLVFENTFSAVNMASSDTLTLTWTVTF